MKTTKAILVLAGVLFLFFYPVSSKALTFDLNVPNPDLSSSTGPYAWVNVVWIDSNDATVTFTRYSPYVIFGNGAYDLNVNGSFVVGGGAITYTPVPSGTPQINNIGYNLVNSVDGFGHFNLQIDLNDGPENGVIDITIPLHLTSGSWTSDTDVLTTNDDGRLAASHIYPPLGTQTGYATNGPTAVPEPGILILLGIAMGAIGVVSWRIPKL
jgi:hypothetical protein